jgi:hypothetical protein
MKTIFLCLSGLLALAVNLYANPGFGQQCVKCHEEETPNIVSDWRLSTHSQNDVGCRNCHGSNVHCGMCHGEGYDVRMPTPETCAECHEGQVQQFRQGKHAAAWAAMKAMPSAHAQPVALTEGMKGCGGCHKIGLKTEDEIASFKETGPGFGIASCDACHTRHIFSVQEARQPQACQTCHMGFDHPQWEMYSSSKHGVRYLLKQKGILPDSVAAPTCQTCHMPEGDHEVRTAWGFLAVRLPMSEDPAWAADQATILRALGVLDLDGNPTERLDVVKAADVVRLTEQSWQQERDEMLGICSQCHSTHFARAELEKGDEMIREADHLLAEAIRVVAGLYEDGVLAKPENYAQAFPDLLHFHDAPTVIEQKLFEMHLEQRMRAFQGTFHANPDYALWYGWSAMQTTLAEIRDLARKLRENNPPA